MTQPASKISVSMPPLVEDQTLEHVVDEDIAAFAKYFCEELRNDSLSKPERSIIKTYLWWKTHQENTGG
jgi:hypothetical protein